MRYIKGFVVTLLIVTAIAGMVWGFFLRDQVKFASIATAYGAKQVCSCRFVGERPMDSCLTDFTVDISLFSFEETEDAVTASVFGGVIASRAIHTEGLGCTLVS